jgi:hypothetical protein
LFVELVLDHQVHFLANESLDIAQGGVAIEIVVERNQVDMFLGGNPQNTVAPLLAKRGVFALGRVTQPGSGYERSV